MTPNDTTGRRHAAVETVPVETALTDDPDLHLVRADLDTWLAAHPCDCQACCECDPPN